MPLPKLMNKPLHSRSLALFTFWTLILVGSWTGIPGGAPLPAWMPALSAIAAVLTILPQVALGLNVLHTKQGARTEKQSKTVAAFIVFGLGMFQLSGMMRVAAALPGVSAITDFTWFTVAQSQLNTYGFFAMTMFGAIYYILPRVTGIEWPFAKSVRAHFWLAAFGIILVAAPLAIGGVLQGLKLNNPQIGFGDLTKATLPFLRVSTTGELLVALGHLLFAMNLTGMVVRFAKAQCAPAFAAATAEMKTAGVKS